MVKWQPAISSKLAIVAPEMFYYTSCGQLASNWPRRTTRTYLLRQDAAHTDVLSLCHQKDAPRGGYYVG